MTNHKSTLGNMKIQFIDGDRSARYPKREEYVDHGILFLNGASIHSGVIDKSLANFISAKKYSEIKKGRFSKNDILLTTRGNSVGDSAFVNIDEIGLINAQMLILRSDLTEVHSKFLFYYLTTKTLRSYITNFASGSAQPQIPIRDLRRVPIFYPDLNAQRKIASILTAYDDLIEVNKRRIALLEQMAKEIYREWFVRMRFPGHQNTRFVKGFPEDWPFDIGSVFFDHVKGKSYSSHEISDEDGDCFFITLKSFYRRGGYRKDGLKYFSGSYKEEQCVETGDVVMAVTDMTQDRAVVGEVARIPKLHEKKALISLDVIRLIPKQMPSTFLYAYMRHSGFANYIKEFANGANVLHLKPDLVGKQRLLFPPKHLRDQFSKVVDPFYQEKDALEEANTLLTKTRDFLLPRLISGKLSVEDLDIQFPSSMQEVPSIAEVEQEASHA